MDAIIPSLRKGKVLALSAISLALFSVANAQIYYQQDFSEATIDQPLEGNVSGWWAGPPRGVSSDLQPWQIREHNSNKALQFSGAQSFLVSGDRALATIQVNRPSDSIGWRVSSDLSFPVLNFSDQPYQSLRIGLGAAGAYRLFSTSSYGAGGGRNFYLADLSLTGSGSLEDRAPSLRILRFDAAGATTEIASLSNMPTNFINTTDSYRFVLQSIYNDDGASLLFSVQNLNSGAVFTINGDDENPLTGNYFGYRHQSAQTNPMDGVTIIHENFIVSAPVIPEAGHVALGIVLLALGAAFMKRRRK